MPRYAILGVEGQHDQAFIAKLFRGLGFQRFEGAEAGLDPFWVPFIPKYPKGGRLYVRMDMPTIMLAPDLEVAIYAGEGTNLRETFPVTFVNNPAYTKDLAAFGIIADSDDSPSVDVAAEYAAAYRQHFPQFPEVPGAVDLSAIRTGIFVLPDNATQGTLEHILLECANVVYPDLRTRAQSYLAGIDRAVLNAEDRAEIRKPAGENKAWASCISSVLKPGKTIQTSIQDNRWLEPRTLALPSVTRVTDFLRQLLHMP